MNLKTKLFSTDTWTGVVVLSALTLLALYLMSKGSELQLGIGVVLLFAVFFLRPKSAASLAREQARKDELRKNYPPLAEFLANAGMKDPLKMEGRLYSSEVLIDPKAKKIVFDFRDNKKRYLYDFDDVTGWEWQWVDRNGKKIQNAIAFKLRDLQNPVLKINMSNASETEQWHSRLGLILNEEVSNN